MQNSKCIKNRFVGTEIDEPWMCKANLIVKNIMEDPDGI